MEGKKITNRIRSTQGIDGRVLCWFCVPKRWLFLVGRPFSPWVCRIVPPCLLEKKVSRSGEVWNPKRISKLGGGNSNIFYFSPCLGIWFNLTSIFFRWVASTKKLEKNRDQPEAILKVTFLYRVRSWRCLWLLRCFEKVKIYSNSTGKGIFLKAIADPCHYGILHLLLHLIIKINYSCR